MSIILEEEEKKQTNWIGIISTLIIVIALFVGGYYLFFKNPELIEVVVPEKFDAIKKIAEVPKFDPGTVLGSQTFKQLKDYTAPLTLPTPGRTNPFRPF